FFQDQKARYGELFWFEIQEQENGRAKLILMLEKLAERVREILNATALNAAAAESNAALEDKNIEVVSFEADDSIGDFYLVEAEQIDVKTRPSQQEYQSIADQKISSIFTDQKNDVFQGQLVKIFQPQNYNSYCLVAYHSFGLRVPRGPIGWLNNLDGLEKIDKKEFQKPANLKTIDQVCKEFEGIKYQLGGGSVKNGFDCSGLIQKIFYQTQGIWLPRKARWQAMVCEKINQEDLRQGDMVFFNKVDDPEKHIDHVGLVYQAQPGRLPIIFHAKRILGKAMFQDLNSADWLYSEINPNGQWEINSFGRVPKRVNDE
ncbi:MAG: NlpC/P60 family protein, partial [Patescibacteria group bacterium]